MLATKRAQAFPIFLSIQTNMKHVVALVVAANKTHGGVCRGNASTIMPSRMIRIIIVMVRLWAFQSEFGLGEPLGGAGAAGLVLITLTIFISSSFCPIGMIILMDLPKLE